jgi:hypothetical protein
VRDIRTILRLTYEQGLSVREVAERLSGLDFPASRGMDAQHPWEEGRDRPLRI